MTPTYVTSAMNLATAGRVDFTATVKVASEPGCVWGGAVILHR